VGCRRGSGGYRIGEWKEFIGLDDVGERGMVKGRGGELGWDGWRGEVEVVCRRCVGGGERGVGGWYRCGGGEGGWGGWWGVGGGGRGGGG